MFSLSTVVVSDRCSPLPVIGWADRYRAIGDLRQDGNTRDMVWSLPELLAELSQRVTLEPGDVVCTGTPAGVGLRTGTFLRPGDVVPMDRLAELKDVSWDWMRLRALGVPLFPS